MNTGKGKLNTIINTVTTQRNKKTNTDFYTRSTFSITLRSNSINSSNSDIGQFLAKLCFKDYHRVASSTNYTREWINSKISENIRSSNRSLAQLVTSTTPCRMSTASNPTPANYFKNIFKLKIDQIIKLIIWLIFEALFLKSARIDPFSEKIAPSVYLSATA